MYPAELEIKGTTDSTISASYLDFLLSIWRDGKLHASIYDKRDDFNVRITDFPFLSSNIPSSTAYDVFISQPIRLSTDFMTLIPSLTFTELWVVSMDHLQRLWHASRESLPFRPQFWNLLVLQLLRPNSLTLPCLYSTFHFQYPLVLSRVCLKWCIRLSRSLFYISTTWWVSLLVDQRIPEGTRSQVLRSTLLDS